MIKKRLILLCIFTSLVTFGQNKEEEKVKHMYWEGKNSQAENTEIPEKWKNESAVILYQEFFYDYHKFATNVRYTSGIRKRIKLLDKISVDDFSEFSFIKKFRVKRGYWGRKGKKFVGIKIIKPNGKVREIEIGKEATQTDNKNEYKIAIPGLEVGDIIDYYVHTVEPFKQRYGYTFESIKRPLNDIYPTKKFVLRFNTENDFFINFNTYNGAPKLKQIDTEKNNDRRYILEAEDLDKSDYPVWFEPLNELPFFKFQVTLARSGKFQERIFNFLSDQEKDVKTSVSKAEVLELFSDKYNRFKSPSILLKRALKDKKLSGKKLIEYAFYFMRHHHQNKYVEPSILRESKIYYSGFDIGINEVFIENSEMFNAKFGNFLMYHKIPFDIIVAMKKENGSIEDMLFSNELTTCIRVNLEEPLYISYFGIHSNLETILPQIEETKAYSLSYSFEDRKLKDIQEITMPGSSSQENSSTKDMILTLDDDFSTFSVTRESNYQGHSKVAILDNLLYFFDYIPEDYKMNKKNSVIANIKKKKEKIRVQKEYDALIEKFKKRQSEDFTSYAKDDLDMELEDYTYEILNTGRFENDKSFRYKDEFTVKDHFIKRAGKNYIIEIGKFIGGQINFKGKDRERNTNIYFDYSRSFINKITLIIPKGYEISGLSNLHKTVKNETGEFTSTAQVKDGKLIVETKKRYYKNYVSKAHWNQLLEFLDEAIQFTSEKILLKSI